MAKPEPRAHWMPADRAAVDELRKALGEFDRENQGPGAKRTMLVVVGTTLRRVLGLLDRYDGNRRSRRAEPRKP